MFDAAVERVLESRRALMFRLLVTDALHEDALRFHERRGMTALTAEGFPRRMVLDLKELIAP